MNDPQAKTVPAPGARLQTARLDYEATAKEIAKLEGEDKILAMSRRSLDREIAEARAKASKQSAKIDEILDEIDQRERGTWVEPSDAPAPTMASAPTPNTETAALMADAGFTATATEIPAATETASAPIAQAAPATGAERLAMQGADASATAQPAGAGYWAQ